MSIYADIALDSDRNQIRLLDILPSAPRDDKVRCHLRCADLDTGPDFHALSYTWGDETVRADIYVNNIVTSVTTNLESAMRHLQSSAYVVTVWADALSINQVDDIEKAHQIRRMHDIYSRAQSTVVWLGPEADGSDMAMKVLLRTGSEARELGLLDHTALALNNGFQNRDPEFQGLRSMIDEIGWLYPFKAVRKLFERPYWSRLWVLQEYALATKIEVRCGTNIIDGDQFNAGYLLLPMLQESLMESARDADFFEPVQAGADYEVDTNQDGYPVSRLEHFFNNTLIAERAGNLVEARNLYESWQIKADVTPQERLCILLERTNTERGHSVPTLGVQNPKDRVFGLLGLLGPGVELGFAIDYEVSDEELYTGVARWLLSYGQMSLLSYTRFRHAIPSWTPNWKGRVRAPNMTKGLFKPSASHSGHARPMGYDIIQFRGLLLDTVTWYGDCWQATNYNRADPDFSWENAERFLAEVETTMAAQPNVPPMLPGMSREQWQEGAWRIPVADQSTNDSGMRIRATGAAKAGWEAMKLGEAPHTVWDRGLGKSALGLYVIAMGRLRGRRLAGTSQGLVGLMTANVETGDIVAIIVGAESPMLLRPASEGGAYKIVGECYVYGIMDGEMIGTDTVFTHIDVC